MIMDISCIRNDFSFLRGPGSPLIYFDNAATTQKPDQVIETIRRFYSEFNAPINRSIHTAGNTASSMYLEARGNISRFINAGSFREIIFTRNATEGINLVCYSLVQSSDLHVRLAAGDEIILPVSEHHSNLVPWQRLKGVGVTVRFAELDGSGCLDPDEIRRLVTSHTKLICCAHISNVIGAVNPVKDIARIAHEAGAMFLVDGTQSAPHMSVDVKDMDCDFFTFSGHKMLAPTGIGVLYGKRELLEKMPPFISGGGMIKDVSLDSSSWNELPWKFEAGTPDACGAIALGGATAPSGERLTGAIDYLKSIGMDAVHTHELDLCSYAMEGILGIDGSIIYGPISYEKRCGIISFNIIKNGETVNPHIIAGFLDDEAIAVRSGGHCAYPLMKASGIEGSVRVSFYIYNTRDEIDVFIKSMQRIIKTRIL
jgi:cysteine desulfurase / selenocysteine lyase